MSNSFFKSITYTFLDLFSLKKGIARRINNMVVRFPARWSRYYESNYEADNYLFLQQYVKPGMHIIDVGAHIGLFSSCSSQLVGPSGKIICFEPTPGTFSVLQQTLRLNHCDNVIALPAAISDKEGNATFYVGQTAGCNTNSLVKNSAKGLTAYDTQLYTIDGIVPAYSLQPSLIKVDAEGAELNVLKGGIKTMKTVRPVIILGLHPDFIAMKGDSLKEIWDLIKACDYKIMYNGAGMNETDFIAQTTLFDVHLIPGGGF